MTTNAITFVFVVAVSILNIALNVWVKKAAGHGSGFLRSILSIPFAVAFVIGACSIVCLMRVYASHIPLSRAVLLMGATSIIGGAVYGLVAKGEQFSITDWLLFTVLVVFYCAAWVKQTA